MRHLHSRYWQCRQTDLVFSHLTYSDSFTQKIADKSTLPDSNKFPNASYAETGMGSDVFVENTGTAYNIWGITTPAMTIEYSNPQQLFKMPLTYTDSLTDTFRTSYTLSSFNVSGTGQSKTFVDAFGTLVMPGKTYQNVLKASITSFQLDTIQSIPPPANTIQTYTFTTVWFDNFNKSPILRVDSIIYNSPTGGNTFKNLFYLKEAGPASVQNMTTKPNKLSISNSNKTLRFIGLETNKPYQLNIYNYSGQTVLNTEFTAPGNEYHKTINDITSGLYIVVIRSKDGYNAIQKILVH